ncbi:nucleotidyltransferase family protein [Geminocystis sp.]|uniref:nucleotidyltransferase family protein n=1 Tax=Geminocystis sp. TaxID=2664100 RepID=UPI003593272B
MTTFKVLNKNKIYLRLKVSPQQLEEFCQQHQIAELALFGSVLRDDFNENSDIDLLVSYQLTAKRGLLVKIVMIEELKELFKREVDLVSKKAIEKSNNWIRRQNILNSAEVIYVA